MVCVIQVSVAPCTLPRSCVDKKLRQPLTAVLNVHTVREAGWFQPLFALATPVSKPGTEMIPNQDFFSCDELRHRRKTVSQFVARTRKKQMAESAYAHSKKCSKTLTDSAHKVKTTYAGPHACLKVLTVHIEKSSVRNWSPGELSQQFTGEARKN